MLGIPPENCRITICVFNHSNKVFLKWKTYNRPFQNYFYFVFGFSTLFSSLPFAPVVHRKWTGNVHSSKFLLFHSTVIQDFVCCLYVTNQILHRIWFFNFWLPSQSFVYLIILNGLCSRSKRNAKWWEKEEI